MRASFPHATNGRGELFVVLPEGVHDTFRGVNGTVSTAHVSDRPAAELPATMPAALSEWDWRRVRLALENVEQSAVDASFLGACCDSDRRYVWGGLIPQSALALLVGAPKAGKSTVERALLQAGDTGEPLFGRAVQPFRALVATEESPRSWSTYDGSNVLLHVAEGQPLNKIADWREKLRQFGALARVQECQVLVIDTISRFCAFDENSARETTRAFAPLRDLAEDEALTVLVTHHTGRSGTVRGSTAIETQSDVILSLDRATDDPSDSARTLTCVSRHDDTQVIRYRRGANGALELVPAAVPAARPKFPAKKER